MQIVSQYQYEDEKRDFFAKHHSDFKCETLGSSAEYYRKTYTFSDGAIWYEIARKIINKEAVEIKKCKVVVEIALMEVEYWCSEYGSKYYYEQWDYNGVN